MPNEKVIITSKCGNCSCSAIPGQTSCRVCRLSRDLADFNRRARRRNSGECLRCGIRLLTRRNVYCLPCREKKAENERLNYWRRKVLANSPEL